MPVKSMYERLGGMSFFEELTERFYARVAVDRVLRPLYPEDLEGSRQRLSLFLAQFWGGPRTYEELQGSPRLRARHEGFRIGAREHAAWLEHMRAALKEAGLGALEETQLLSYFESVASHLVNTRDDVDDLGSGEPHPVPGCDGQGPARLPTDKRGA
jgi:hemoglobin